MQHKNAEEGEGEEREREAKIFMQSKRRKDKYKLGIVSARWHRSRTIRPALKVASLLSLSPKIQQGRSRRANNIIAVFETIIGGACLISSSEEEKRGLKRERGRGSSPHLHLRKEFYS